jgi:putative protease
VTWSPRPPEVLAPAGTPEALDAAVRAGADAVYFGLGAFNARARARNFEAAELGPTLKKLHAHGVRGYVALNTLVFDPELEAVAATLREIAEAGADAVIVQDVGVAELAREIVPTLPLHASTQMTCTDAAAVTFAASLGARRVVLARELSLEAIRAIRAKCDLPLEVFVHGALCIAYSGQCQTSEAIGGRSANRGACAQACRLPYDLVVDGVVKNLGDKAYLLSPEDLEASAYVPALIEAGVASLKIEGRLKSPAYVAAATRLYREAVDAAMDGQARDLEAWRSTAALTYSRGFGPGFLAGVDHQRLVDGKTNEHRGVLLGEVVGRKQHAGRSLLEISLVGSVARGDGLLVEGGRASNGEAGGKVWALFVGGRELDEATAGERVQIWFGPDQRLPEVAPGRRVFKNGSPAAQRQVASLLNQAPREGRLALRLVVRGEVGQPLWLEGTLADGRAARVASDVVLVPATGAGLDEARLADQLGRLGGTPFRLESLQTELGETALHMPVSALNRARRSLVEALSNLATPARDPEVSATAPFAASFAASSVAPAVAPGSAPAAETPAPPPGGLFVLCRNVDQAEAAMAAGADGVYLDFLALTGTGEALRRLRGQGVSFVGVAPPRVRLPGEEKIDNYLEGLVPDARLIRGWGALQDLKERPQAGAPLLVGDVSLNLTNQRAIATVMARGLHAFAPALDLDASQIQNLVESSWAPYCEVVLHHPTPLFYMEHCVMAALLSDGRDYRTCGRPCEAHAVALRDRAGHIHPVEADVGCRNTVFHAAAQSAVHLVPGLLRAGVRRFRLELVREDRPTVERLVRGYRAVIASRSEPAELWRDLRAASGSSVVRGALRVLG